MKKVIILIILLIFFIESEGEIRKALVSIPPLQSLSNFIGGKYWEFSLILPKNVNPHVFEPKPETFKLVEKAELVIINGGDIDYWVENILKDKRKKLLNVSYNIKFEDNNPHIWLDPILAKKISENIYEKLKSMDVKNKEYYYKNFKNLIKKLEELDREIKIKFSKYKKKEVIIYHPAWYYFFKRYNIKTLGIIEEGEGKEPSPRKVAEIINLIKEKKIKYILKEPYNISPVLNMISKETGTKLITLDPLGYDKDYFSMMRENIKILEMIFNEQNN
ncbi:MAG: metal ABC transporter substrate-binding protein [Dictyoglomaceae bacterium]|nr:metal ABC transporter substrate-binding protein [Dictyoglomaceae bacterium]